MALLLCFPAARNLAPNSATYFVFRRLLELFRCVPDIVYALILVWTFGVGANWAKSVRFGILPQVLPNFLSYVLPSFEINVRGATVIGFVGSGLRTRATGI